GHPPAADASRAITDDRVIGCAFSFARSRVRAFNGSMFWLGQRAARARLDGGERRGHMQPNTPRRKNARTRERVNAEAARVMYETLIDLCCRPSHGQPPALRLATGPLSVRPAL